MNAKMFYCRATSVVFLLLLLSWSYNATAHPGGIGYSVSYGVPNKIGLGFIDNGRPLGALYYNPGRYIMDADIYTPLYVSLSIDHNKIGCSFFSAADFILLPLSAYLGGLYTTGKGLLPWDDFAINFLLLNNRTNIYFKRPSFDYGFFIERGFQAYLYSDHQYDTFTHEMGIGALVDYKRSVTRLGVFHDHVFNDGKNSFYLKIDAAVYLGL
jgi:hypothetical protein